MPPHARLLASLFGILALVACGNATDVASGPGDQAPASIAGMWEVEGQTVEPGNEENARPIRGTIVLTQEGAHYVSSFEMKTLFPTPGGASMDTDVIGKGDGSVQGNQIQGTAHTQLVVATVPGIDTAFAFIPRQVSTRIVSQVSGELRADGTLSLTIKNTPEEGEDYLPSSTTLRGRRAKKERGAAE